LIDQAKSVLITRTPGHVFQKTFIDYLKKSYKNSVFAELTVRLLRLINEYNKLKKKDE
jgi:hypothetical protein